MATRFASAARLLALLLVAAFASGAAPVATADGHCKDDGTCYDPRECTQPGSAYADFGNVQMNGVTLQTQVGGTTLLLPLREAGLAVSTTGNLDVEIVHRCVKSYVFSWTVQSSVNPTTTGSVTMAPACVGGTDTHTIPVGNDVVAVHMELLWHGCDGGSGMSVRDIKVVDPNLSI